MGDECRHAGDGMLRRRAIARALPGRGRDLTSCNEQRRPCPPERIGRHQPVVRRHAVDRRNDVRKVSPCLDRQRPTVHQIVVITSWTRMIGSEESGSAVTIMQLAQICRTGMNIVTDGEWIGTRAVARCNSPQVPGMTMLAARWPGGQHGACVRPNGEPCGRRGGPDRRPRRYLPHWSEPPIVQRCSRRAAVQLEAVHRTSSSASVRPDREFRRATWRHPGHRACTSPGTA